LALATSTLQTLTLNRVGTCPITIRPCADLAYGCACGAWFPVLWDGQWFNCRNCKYACAPLSEVDIPGPVGYIERLVIDGMEVDIFDPDDWRLDNGHLLVWQGAGPSPIPAYQDLNKPDTKVGTWSLTYSQSYPVGDDGRLAVAQLAVEFAEAFKPRGKCSLPRGVTNVVRNGVTFSVDGGLFINGLTGNQVADLFILKWVPPGSPQRSAEVFSPSKHRRPPRQSATVPLRGVSGNPMLNGGTF
jgi:hypothetical protein